MTESQLFSPQDKNFIILKAAKEIFSQKGFHNTTISQVAKAAGVASGTIYEYFENKEALFFSIASARCEAFDKELTIHLSGLKCSFDKIRKYIWFYLYFFQKDPIYADLLLLNMRVNPRFSKSEAYAWVKKSTREIIEMVQEGQSDGMFRDDIDAYSIRHLILGSLEHVTTRWLLKGKSFDMLAESEKISNLIIEAIKRR